MAIININYKTATDAEYEKAKQAISNSKDCKSCPKPPVPDIADDENYVFISYSHKDYKLVYRDLLELGKRKVRFKYDGEYDFSTDWLQSAINAIKSPKCSAVIFYLSEYFFVSEPCYQEVEAAGLFQEDENLHKNSCRINLCGNISYSDIVTEKIGGNREFKGIDPNCITRMSNLYTIAFPETKNYEFFDEEGGETYEHYIENNICENLNKFNVVGDSKQENPTEKELDEAKKELDLYKKELHIARSFSIKRGVLFEYLVDGKEVFIPDGVKEIEAKVFRGCSSLEHVVIPDSVTKIGEAAFEGCSGLESIIISNGVKTIGDGAFEGCSSLENIVIPDRATLPSLHPQNNYCTL